MTTSNTLADTIRADYAKKAEEAIKEAEAKTRIASAFDSVGYTGTAPDFVHSYGKRGLYGAAGSVSFKDTAPDEALRMLAAFPPIACGLYRDGNTSTVAPIGAAGERYTLAKESDGITLRLDGGHGYGQRVKLDWYTDANGVRLHMTAELVGSYMPRIQPGRAVHRGDTFIRYEGTDSLAWQNMGPASADFVRYGRGSPTALQQFTVYSHVREWLEAVAAKLDAEQRETLASYTRASAGLSAPRIATAAECEALADWYGRQSLRAGTLLQSATMQSDTAKAWEQVARDHWRQFARAHGIEAGRYGFDHYGFTLWYLTRAECLTDNGYKYGSAWL